MLDPVGVGASAFRRKMAEELLEAVTFTAIRGNMSEIRTLSELAEKKGDRLIRRRGCMSGGCGHGGDACGDGRIRKGGL